ncbi:hypothetical protein LMXM_18_0595 [Leishmania mexicana MHOM/GT/2001/U1103]|uniref:Uncharacterized protein n=1 Tax=Leishmania mexicana (strain MHOM/GT/2001/U1103) TaxID=929439 RepID=E9ARJ7_LEIMU|nr:hypothetical protein LMXM_18_0595 [Leishmania mexicana MHOM/GT/2001/U1103]CBZ25568.1 hypothetical protein LMXM_18_0595 [Leishmania mexicana MHOM/GT/2001/U1103]
MASPVVFMRTLSYLCSPSCCCHSSFVFHTLCCMSCGFTSCPPAKPSLLRSAERPQCFCRSVLTIVLPRTFDCLATSARSREKNQGICSRRGVGKVAGRRGARERAAAAWGLDRNPKMPTHEKLRKA